MRHPRRRADWAHHAAIEQRKLEPYKYPEYSAPPEKKAMRVPHPHPGDKGSWPRGVYRYVWTVRMIRREQKGPARPFCPALPWTRWVQVLGQRFAASSSPLQWDASTRRLSNCTPIARSVSAFRWRSLPSQRALLMLPR